MKVRQLGVFTAVVVVALVGRAIAQVASQSAECADANWPALPSSDPAYSPAVDFARILANHGVTVTCIAPSRMTGTFEGQSGAAIFRTNVGSFDVLFLPKPQTFNLLEIIERQESRRYLYSFAGHPKPWPANLIDASRRVYFIKSVNRLVVAYDRELATHIEGSLEGR